MPILKNLSVLPLVLTKSFNAGVRGSLVLTDVPWFSPRISGLCSFWATGCDTAFCHNWWLHCSQYVVTAATLIQLEIRTELFAILFINVSFWKSHLPWWWTLLYTCLSWFYWEKAWCTYLNHFILTFGGAVHTHNKELKHFRGVFRPTKHTPGLWVLHQYYGLHAFDHKQFNIQFRHSINDREKFNKLSLPVNSRLSL